MMCRSSKAIRAEIVLIVCNLSLKTYDLKTDILIIKVHIKHLMLMYLEQPNTIS